MQTSSRDRGRGRRRWSVGGIAVRRCQVSASLLDYGLRQGGQVAGAKRAEREGSQGGVDEALQVLPHLRGGSGAGFAPGRGTLVAVVRGPALPRHVVAVAGGTGEPELASATGGVRAVLVGGRLAVRVAAGIVLLLAGVGERRRLRVCFGDGDLDASSESESGDGGCGSGRGGVSGRRSVCGRACPGWRGG